VFYLLGTIWKKPIQGFKSHRLIATARHCLSMSQFDESSILFQWAAHNDASFHDFDTDEASKIRQSLLTWYHTNRRKLPWRGDPPPYDGSTAGTNDVKTKAKKNGKKELDTQTSIQSFFLSTSTKEKGKSRLEAEDKSEPLPISAYGIWVSEIMLQQTRVEAVIPYYLKWMKTFPTVQDLANASDEEVNAHWAGLGFYRRARLLHKGAKLVVDKYGGKLPNTVEELMRIDGIGQYTGSAIASIAFDVCVPVVDGNVCRVLSRLRGIANNIKAPILKDKLGWGLAEQIVKAGDGKNAGDVNQALMELGATYCSPSGTGVDSRDPLKEFYLSTKLAKCFAEQRKNLAKNEYESFPVDAYLDTARHGDQMCALCGESKGSALTEFNDAWNQGQFTTSHGPFPLAPPKASKRDEVLAVAVLKDGSNAKDDKWLLVKRPKEGLLAGQWEFPSICVWSSADEKQSSRKKRKDGDVPFIDENIRSDALSLYLDSLAVTSKTTPSMIRRGQRTRLQESVDHIFSHVRHIMWIEHQTIDDGTLVTSWTSTSGKELRWMSKDDMEKVGVTSGVKKILNAVAAISRKRSKRS
jgi:A/G-specific adenine glycosylase